MKNTVQGYFPRNTKNNFQSIKILIGIIFIFSSQLSWAQSLPKCSDYDKLIKEEKHYQISAYSLNDSVQNFNEIAKDARRLNLISAGLAATSGIILAVVTRNGIKVTGDLKMILTPEAVSWMPVIQKAYLTSAAWRINAGVAAGTTVLVGITATAFPPVFIVGIAAIGGFPALAMAEITYPVAVGLYEFLTPKGKVHISEADVTQAEDVLLAEIQNIRNERKSLFDTIPSTISNSLTFGGANADHFGKIATLAALEQNYLQTVADLKRVQIKMLQSVCR